jgi:hypothetical protein
MTQQKLKTHNITHTSNHKMSCAEKTLRVSSEHDHSCPQMSTHQDIGADIVHDEVANVANGCASVVRKSKWVSSVVRRCLLVLAGEEIWLLGDIEDVAGPPRQDSSHGRPTVRRTRQHLLLPACLQESDR